MNAKHITDVRTVMVSGCLWKPSLLPQYVKSSIQQCTLSDGLADVSVHFTTFLIMKFNIFTIRGIVFLTFSYKAESLNPVAVHEGRIYPRWEESQLKKKVNKFWKALFIYSIEFYSYVYSKAFRQPLWKGIILFWFYNSRNFILFPQNMYAYLYMVATIY